MSRENVEVIPLRDYFEKQFELRDIAAAAALRAMEYRLDGMNEFRASLNDQQKTFISRPEWGLAHQRLVDDVQSLREGRAAIEGKASIISVLLVSALSICSIVISLIAWLTHK